MATNATSFPSIHVECYGTYHKFPLYGWQELTHKILPLCCLLIWLPSVVLNFVALLVYLEKQMRMRIANLFILNTIIADLFTGLFSIPLGACQYVLIAYLRKYYCIMYAIILYVGYIFCIISFIMLFYASIDRFVAVFKPYFYSTRVAHCFTMCNLILVLTWFFSILVVVSGFFVGSFIPTFLLVAGLNLLVMIDSYVNIKVWFAVHFIRKTIQKERILQCYTKKGKEEVENSHNRNIQNSNTRKTGHESLNTCQVSEEKKCLRENRRLNKSISILLMSLFVCYLPFLVIGVLWSTGYENDICYTLSHIAVFLAFCKSFLNPIIYWYTMPTVKRKMKTLLFCNKKRRFVAPQFTKNQL